MNEADPLREAAQKACDDHLGRVASSEPFTADDYRRHGIAAYRILRAALNDCDGIFPGAPCGATFWHDPHDRREPVARPSPAAPRPEGPDVDPLREALHADAQLCNGYAHPTTALVVGKAACFSVAARIRAAVPAELDVDRLRRALEEWDEGLSRTVWSDAMPYIAAAYARLDEPPAPDEPPEGLDVQRLAIALHQAGVDCLNDDSHRRTAQRIADWYDRLAGKR